jgi:antitoxin component YwqK of YwqJK toxin-antitoxin module
MNIYISYILNKIKNKNKDITFKIINNILHEVKTTITTNSKKEIKTVIEYFVNGKLHREGDKPASFTHVDNFYQYNSAVLSIIHDISQWYINGNLHRESDKPAYVQGRVNKWYINGKLHREGDKPAYLIIDEKDQAFYINGLLHREVDKPAKIETTDIGSISYWYINGKLHRNNQPAIVYSNGYGEAYYRNGELHSYDSYSSNFVQSDYKHFIDLCQMNLKIRMNNMIEEFHNRDQTQGATKRKINEYPKNSHRDFTFHLNGKESNKEEILKRNKISKF